MLLCIFLTCGYIVVLTTHIILNTNRTSFIWEVYMLTLFLFFICIASWCGFVTDQNINMNKNCIDYENGNIIKQYTVDQFGNKIDSIYVYK